MTPLAKTAKNTAMADSRTRRLANSLTLASLVLAFAFAAYSASKSAAWSLTNALRNELVAQKTQVLGLHMGYVDTDLTHGFDVPKSSPEEIVKRALDGLESGVDEVLADEPTRLVKAAITAPRPSYLPQRASGPAAAQESELSFVVPRMIGRISH